MELAKNFNNFESVEDRLLEKITAKLDFQERTVLKEALTKKIEEYFDENNLPNYLGTNRELEFYRLANTLKKLTSFHQDMPDSGIGFHGRPNWLTPSLFKKIQKEAEFRKNEPLDQIDHAIGCGGKIADAVSVMPEVVNFIQKNSGPIKPTGIASYMYYDKHGSGIRPHVDTEVFSMNLIIMLKHKAGFNGKKSSTSVFPAYQNPTHYYLEPGETLLLYGSSTVHTRTRVHEGEEIQLLTIGFNRI